jgi:hypothetical protein
MVSQYSRMSATPVEVLIDKPLYQMPSWNCCCCEDTGTILDSSIRNYNLIPGYNALTDKPVLCRREGCSAWSNFGSTLLTQDYNTNQFLILYIC